MDVDPGQSVTLTARGSSDPDGDRLSYRWWVYREAGTYWANVPIRADRSPQAVVDVPESASGRTIHIILEVLDGGKPPLTAYRRVILNVSGEPAEAPVEARPLEEYLRTPVEKLRGPEEEDGRWEFYRGINLNGSPLEIDGNKWYGDNAPGFACTDRAVDSPGVALKPPTNETRAKMIHSFRWNRRAQIMLRNVPLGKYAVYAYVWEDNNPETFSIMLQEQVATRDYYSGQEGQWRRLGPWVTTVSNGVIRITSSGGAANFSGIEIWKAIEP